MDRSYFKNRVVELGAVPKGGLLTGEWELNDEGVKVGVRSCSGGCTCGGKIVPRFEIGSGRVRFSGRVGRETGSMVRSCVMVMNNGVHELVTFKYVVV